MAELGDVSPVGEIRTRSSRAFALVATKLQVRVLPCFLNKKIKIVTIMEINMLSVYFASLVMCVVIGCIPFVIGEKPEITKEKKRKFLFMCVVV